MKLAIAALLVVVLGARPAAACGVPDFGAIFADVARAFQTKETKVDTPVVVLGYGTTTEGRMLSLAAGYAWGVYKDDWLFDGSSLKRVLVNVRSDGDEDTAIATTFGWYSSQGVLAAFDIGAETQVTGTFGIGPTARLTLGIGGVGLRLFGGVMVGEESRSTAGAELVLDLDFAGRRGRAKLAAI